MNILDKIIETYKNWSKNDLFNFSKDVILIVITVLIIKTFIIAPFVIEGKSMENSYHPGEFIIVDKISYYFHNPRRGDVIVFEPHVSKKKPFFIKRIIGIPGDELKISDGLVYIKPLGKKTFTKLNETYLSDTNIHCTITSQAREIKCDKNGVSPKGVDEKIYTLGKNQYFAMGDNRLGSTDARDYFGDPTRKEGRFIAKKDIIGKVWLDFGYFDFFGKWKFVNDVGDETPPRIFSSPASHTYKELENAK